jgi:hypothetical protein
MTILFVSFGRAWISRSASPSSRFIENGLLLFVSKLEMDSLAVAIVRVRDNAVIADRADVTGDIVELFTHTPDVHVKDHSRKGCVLFRVRDECFHHTVGSSDLDELFSHLVFLSNGRRNFRDRLNFRAKELRQTDFMEGPAYSVEFDTSESFRITSRREAATGAPDNSKEPESYSDRQLGQRRRTKQWEKRP